MSNAYTASYLQTYDLCAWEIRVSLNIQNDISHAGIYEYWENSAISYWLFVSED